MLSQTEPTSRPKGDGASAVRVLVTYAPDETVVGTARFASCGLQIGRGPSAAAPFVIDDSEMSRAHVVFEGDADALTVRDLGSRNGTYVDGVRVDVAPLRHGTVLRLGSTTLVIEHVGSEHVSIVATAQTRSSRILGNSFAILGAVSRARSFAPLAVPVLLLGETGVGKELFALEVHEASGRTGPFIPVNCAALPDHLVESELFGHERGAFTGAERKSDGLFGAAEGGTLFLDEIGEMPLPLQAKLLRALANAEVRGVGATRNRSIDVRVIAATNLNLEHAVGAGLFRGDLFARLAGGVVEIPPLRARHGDILQLARELLVRGSSGRRRTGAIAEHFSPDAAEALSIHRWPFNVRELEQMMRLCAALVPIGPLPLEQLPSVLRAALDARTGSATDVSAAELALLNIAADRVPNREELEHVLAYFGGSMSQAAGFFGKDRRQLYRWAERLGVSVGSDVDG